MDIWEHFSTNMAKEETKDKPFTDLVRAYFRHYCQKSTIHCVRYLYDPHLHNVERLIWCILLIISLIMCWIFYLILSERYVAQKLQTVVEDPQYPVFIVHFPAVGVCTDNRINWTKLEAAKLQFLPVNASGALVRAFTKLVMGMETLRFGNFQQGLAELEDDNLEAVDFVNINNLALFLTPRCEDLMVNGTCMWRNAPFDCCEYFVLERTEYGYCLVFNSELSPRSKEIRSHLGRNFYPRHNSKAGQGSGLNFDLMIDDRYRRPNSLASEKVFIMIKKSNQMSNAVYSITPNTETYVTVRPEITWTDESTRSMPPERRNCLFPDEQIDFGASDAVTRFSKKFLLTNCLNQCHESYLVKFCNCTLPIFFFNNSRVNECNAVSLRCLSRHNDFFSYDKLMEEDAYFSATKPGMACYCLVSCDLLEYYTSTTTLPLPARRIPKEEHQSLFKVDVHYQVEMTLLYRTRLEFSSIDLIANLGGIFGLCLGASMVSVVELIYYLTVGFALHLYDHAYYGILWKWMKLKCKKVLHYFHNGAGNLDDHQQEEEQPKLRHPFNNKIGAW